MRHNYLIDDGRHRAEFYRMWATGFGAGFTHPKSLETMGPRESPLTESAREWLLAGTRNGRDLSSLVRTGGNRFEEFERVLITLGEESGSLDKSLRLLGDFYMRKHQLMLWVKKQLAYPFFTALAACFIAPFPLLFFGHTTAYIVAALGAAALVLFNAGMIMAAVAARYGRKPALARARMARALTTAIEAGLTLPRALRLAADASANPEIQSFVRAIPEKDLATSSMVRTLAHCPHLTPEFIGMLRTAEETGDFTPLARLAELYEDGFST